MVALTSDEANDGCDSSPGFLQAMSLLAALERAKEQDGHARMLPFLGMARAELTDFGGRRPERYIPIQIGDLNGGLADLERCLNALMSGSMDLRQSLRIDAALRTLRRGVLDARRSRVHPDDDGGDRAPVRRS